MAFLKYQATGDLNVRLGRIPAPLFMVSEYRKVGYVNPWIRQPNEVYFQVPFNSLDGGDVPAIRSARATLPVTSRLRLAQCALQR